MTDDNFSILFSIHPEYAEAILRGEKKIELRKTNIKHWGNGTSTPQGTQASNALMNESKTSVDQPSCVSCKHREYVNYFFKAGFFCTIDSKLRDCNFVIPPWCPSKEDNSDV